MAKKQTISKETAAAAAPASAARTAKPRTPRVTAAQHSKVVSTEPALTEPAAAEPVAVAASAESPNEVVAKIAYSYWEARGYQGGSAIEDWVRAEQEHRQRLAATRL